jgi:hypothetical protein
VDDELSLVTKRRDYSDIIQLQDAGTLEEFLEQPLTFVAETITGALGVGTKGISAAGGRIVQALLKGRHFQQWAIEFKKFRDDGRIPPDFAEKRYGFQTWVELMTIIDEEAPDVDRLDALKAMFFAVNKAGIADGEHIASYQLWQIAKGMASGELFLLKIVYEQRDLFKKAAPNGYQDWEIHMAKSSGHEMKGLVGLHERRLTELGLLSPRFLPDLSGIVERNARLTDLGMSFCSNIETYRLEVNR